MNYEPKEKELFSPKENDQIIMMKFAIEKKIIDKDD